MAKYSTTDPYTEKGVLKNKLSITDSDVLERAEGAIVALRIAEILITPVQGNFDLRHLQAIHRCLFGDLYTWAGEIRIIDISKGETLFAHHQHIEAAAHLIFEALAKEGHLQGLAPERFAARAAHYLSEINALHPFRDGNGRSGRIFIETLARRNGYSIDFAAMETDDMLDAMIESFHRTPRKLTQLISQNLRPYTLP